MKDNGKCVKLGICIFWQNRAVAKREIASLSGKDGALWQVFCVGHSLLAVVPDVQL
jgi:hypothetical protein